MNSSENQIPTTPKSIDLEAKKQWKGNVLYMEKKNSITSLKESRPDEVNELFKSLHNLVAFPHQLEMEKPKVYDFIRTLQNHHQLFCSLDTSTRTDLGFYLMLRIMEFQWKGFLCVETAALIYHHIACFFDIMVLWKKALFTYECWNDDMFASLFSGLDYYQNNWFVYFYFSVYGLEACQKQDNWRPQEGIDYQTLSQLAPEDMELLGQNLFCSNKNLALEIMGSCEHIKLLTIPDYQANTLSSVFEGVSCDNLVYLLREFTKISTGTDTKALLSGIWTVLKNKNDVTTENKHLMIKVFAANLCRGDITKTNVIEFMLSCVDEETMHKIFPTYERNQPLMLTMNVILERGLKAVCHDFNVFCDTDEDFLQDVDTVAHRFYETLSYMTEEKLKSLIDDSFCEWFFNEATKGPERKRSLARMFQVCSDTMQLLIPGGSLGRFIAEEKNKELLGFVMTKMEDSSYKEMVVSACVSDDYEFVSDYPDLLYLFFKNNEDKVCELEKWGPVFESLMKHALEKKDLDFITLLSSGKKHTENKNKRKAVEIIKDDDNENDDDDEVVEEEEEEKVEETRPKRTKLVSNKQKKRRRTTPKRGRGDARVFD
jgi:hypothetical protein